MIKWNFIERPSAGFGFCVWPLCYLLYVYNIERYWQPWFITMLHLFQCYDKEKDAFVDMLPLTVWSTYVTTCLLQCYIVSILQSVGKIRH